MHVIRRDFARPSAAVIEKAKNTFACIAGQVVGRHGVMDAGIRPLTRNWRIAGPALTVAPANPLDTLVSRVATQYVQPGDVMVVDSGGRMDAATWGATMAWAAKEAGAAGVIIDGAVLTTELLIDREGLPIFARGSTTGHVGGDGPGSINVPIVCGGIIVRPGDIVVADEDGVVVLPQERAEALLDKAGQGRGKPFPPASRSKPYGERGFEEKLRAFDGISWE